MRYTETNMARAIKRMIVSKRETRAKNTRKRRVAPVRSRLREIREEIIAEGTPLLSLEEIRREAAERRGSYADHLR